MNNKLKLQGLLRDMVNEETVNGIKVTTKAQKESKKFNDEYNKDVAKKMKDYEEPVTPKEDKDIDKYNKPGNIEGEDEEFHNQYEIRNGLEMTDTDATADDRFKERQEMALKGDSKMGNKTHEGEWNPETGEGNGNTEEVWGASGGKHTGEEILKHAEASKKKRAKAAEKLNSPVTSVSRRDLDDTKINKVNENKNTMKRLRFKKPFDGVGNALNLIPENYKIDEKEFEMTDGNESYTMRWEGTLAEGAAVVLKAADQTMINEDMAHMKHLMGFKSEETLGRLKGSDRINENETFKDVWAMTQNLMNENATGVAGMGFVAESDDDDEDDIDVNDTSDVIPDMNEDDKVSAKVKHANAEGPMVMKEDDDEDEDDIDVDDASDVIPDMAG